MSSTVQVLGYPVSAAGLLGDIEAAWGMIRSGRSGHHVACLNPHSLVVARADRVFENALKRADLLLPDGIGIVLAARMLNAPLRERVAGYEFFSGLNARAARDGGMRNFFFGATDSVLERIEARLTREFPGVSVCGKLSPPFKKSFGKEDRWMVDRINAARPDVLWVGMTAPKQETWVEQNRALLDVPLIGSIGAVFDYYAGTKSRAPPWMRRMGLEWLLRLVTEPRHTYRRYVIHGPVFAGLVAREKCRLLSAHETARPRG